MIIRTAAASDLKEVAAVEAMCFPSAEAATTAQFSERIKYYGNHFWLVFDDDRLVAFVNGFVTDEADLTDEMYEKFGFKNEGVSTQSTHGNVTWNQMRLTF